MVYMNLDKTKKKTPTFELSQILLHLYQYQLFTQHCWRGKENLVLEATH